MPGAMAPGALVRPKALHFLVIGRPAFCAWVCDTRAATRVADDPGVRIVRGGRDKLVALVARRIPKALVAKAAPTISVVQPTSVRRPVQSKHYRRLKVCRIRDERPISGGEYCPSSREQLGRQGLYPSVTI